MQCSAVSLVRQKNAVAISRDEERYQLSSKCSKIYSKIEHVEEVFKNFHLMNEVSLKRKLCHCISALDEIQNANIKKNYNLN